MAITIHQEPTTPNMANNDLLFVVTSNTSSAAQFQYVCDIRNTSDYSLLQRIKQQPNPDAYGVFNVGQIVTQYLGSDNAWKAAPIITGSTSIGEFSVLFGEQYGVSPSSSITTYNGINTTPSQDPAKSGSAYYHINNGLVDPYNAVNWNFASASFYTAVSASAYITYSLQHILSNAPLSQSVQDGEYATVSIYNGNFMDPISDVFAQDINWIQVRFYNSSGTNIQSNDYYNIVSNGGGPRTANTDLWSTVAANQTTGTRLLHFGVGPQNIEDSGISIPSTWAYYTVGFYGQGDDGLENNTGQIALIRFDKSTGACSYNGVRFAWKNEYGVWDYYTFTLQSDTASTIDRESYEQTFVNYSTDSNTIPYDKSRRGTSQFYNGLTKRQTANSDWLVQEEADWLRELFYSTNVYIQVGSDFEPVVVTTVDLVEKTNPRTQKNFQYTLEFEPANQPRPRL